MRNKKYICLVTFVILMYSDAAKPNFVHSNGTFKTVKHEPVKDIKLNETKITNLTNVSNKASVNFSKTPPKVNKLAVKMITPGMVAEWATEISKKLFAHEEKVVRRGEILKPYTNIKTEVRNGSVIIDRIAKDLEDLFLRRAMAAENIMRKAEELSITEEDPSPEYVFSESKNLNKIKPVINYQELDNWEKPLSCISLNKERLKRSSHFDANVSLDVSSVHVADEVFPCNPQIVRNLHYSERLLQTFRSNYAHDSMIGFQYFCNAEGFLRHYPAASWLSMIKLDFNNSKLGDVYDCRLRHWYVSAGGAPRDILILQDATGSMNSSSNEVVAESFTLALLNALTDDDHVNVLRYNLNVNVESPIKCFNDKMVSANHVNTAAIMEAMKGYQLRNESRVDEVLEYSVRFLQREKEKATEDGPSTCQQAIVLLTDSLYFNYTELMKHLDPEGNIRIFVFWLHDIYGLRDNTKQWASTLSCFQDGYFAELTTNSDVTLQVLRILKVLERPLVSQRKQRFRVFSDIYAHIEDPRNGEYHWRQKENLEQRYRYRQLRRNKNFLLSPAQTMRDYMHQVNREENGQYYEGEDIDYRMMVTVSVPVFEHTTEEKITIQLDEYPVNRLLGVAGVDIPVDHLKLYIPYYELGPGGSFILADHRGSIVIHDNMKPLFDGDILKPGYRTVDFLDLEQAAVIHPARHYPTNWLNFRRSLIVDQPKGVQTLFGKNIFGNGMRANLEHREYHWRRIIDHYTAIVVLPPYARHHAVWGSKFTQKLAEDALKALAETDFSVHPDWLYCHHVEQYYERKIDEVEHFLRRRKEEPNFAMEQLKHQFYPIPPTLLERTYKCDEKLMAWLSSDAIATEQWAREHEEPEDRDCKFCPLGSTTAFFATESGLTRWQQYHATSSHVEPPEGSAWPRGPLESWYRRAAASPTRLVIHAPVYPERRMRNTDVPPKPIGVRADWFTAARTLGIQGKGNIGVTGYHFHPSHLKDIVVATVNFPCQEEDEDKCEAQCDGETWDCVIIDDAGWVITGEKELALDEPPGEGVRQHLSAIYPEVMAALLNASVFELNWVHDYQAVCFNPEDDSASEDSSAQTLQSILMSMTRSVSVLFQITSQAASLLWLLLSTSAVEADTTKEREKRRNRTRKDYAREKFDTLYDDRVLVNRTKFAACDRSRPIYELQQSARATAALNRSAEVGSTCTWPLVAAPIDQTNLLLIAVYTLCPYQGRTDLPNPMNNGLVNMSLSDELTSRSANRLACWRNRIPLPGRPPASTCYPHDYTAEEGYRQCGEWLPDPETDGASYCQLSIILLAILLGGLILANSKYIT